MSNYKRYYNFGKIVFITIVTYNRQPILTDNIELIRKAWKSVKYKFRIIAGVVLKDHMHILIEAEDNSEIPKIISFFKQYVSKNIQSPPIQTDIQQRRQEKGVWQRRYYDHIIRNEQDLNRHIDYIHYNPMKHYNIAPKNWKYSTFNKFVQMGMYEKEWCNFGDKNKINDLDLE
jgi:putative transposase